MIQWTSGNVQRCRRFAVAHTPFVCDEADMYEFERCPGLSLDAISNMHTIVRWTRCFRPCVFHRVNDHKKKIDVLPSVLLTPGDR